MFSQLGYGAAPTPGTIWVELTSKCPADCVFCSRNTRRGSGEHLPFELFESLISQLDGVRKFILNYSGESTVYPQLVQAIQIARCTGAFVELVTALVTASEQFLLPLAHSGLNRLTVSVHAAEPSAYTQIYRYGSFDGLRRRLKRLAEICAAMTSPPVIDFAFVAMHSNIDQLPAVASLADEMSIRNICVFPVLRRDEIPTEFPIELTRRGWLRPSFDARVRAMVEKAERLHPEIRFQISTPETATQEPLGAVPIATASPLPAGAHIHSCEQNPWETTHILSNGDVVPCEVLDRQSMGNVKQQSLADIWHGEAYRRFRRMYRHGLIPECRLCPWKRAFVPAPLVSEIIAARGMHAQLLHGWHEPCAERHIWSAPRASAILSPRPGSRALHVSGILPPGPSSTGNELTVIVNGDTAGSVRNTGDGPLAFGLDFRLPESTQSSSAWNISFRAAHVYRAAGRGQGADQRDLGFALVLMSSQPPAPLRSRRSQVQLRSIRHWIHGVDLLSSRVLPRRAASPVSVCTSLPRGVSVLIPERNNLEELAACLDSVEAAVSRLEEPWEVLIAVNGTQPSAYRPLRTQHPAFRWSFHSDPLAFSRAIEHLLRRARYGWVYLLNSDVELHPQALAALMPHRRADLFSIGSQIFLKDSTRFREESNWGALLIESGLATIHDWIPPDDMAVPAFYTGGGASLFQRSLLLRFLDTTAYEPFYWEDVEWGWRARKSGYESLLVPASTVRHRQRATIGRHYTSHEIETIVTRNRLLFQLRNFFTVGSLDSAMDAIAAATLEHWFARPATLWKIARGRVWNRRSSIADDKVFSTWRDSLPPPTPRSPSSSAVRPDLP